MSTAIVDGGPCGPDGAGGTYRNRILTDRAAWWEAMGGRQGIRRGGVVSPVAGQMNLEVTAFLATVEERDIAGNTGAGRGYVVWSEDTTVAAFGGASTSDRMDALVIAFCDPSVGTAAFGTEVNAAGGQVIVVPGTSGVTTPLTNTDISAAVGSGGWVRLADVLVQSTDTEIQAANVTENLDASAAPPYVRVESAATQSVPSGSTTDVSFGTVAEQNRSGFNVTPTSVEIPEDGYYVITAGINWDATNNDGIRHAQILADGPAGLVSASDTFTAFQGPGANEMQTVGFPKRLLAGQVVSVQVHQTSGSALDASAGSYLEVRRVRDL